VPEDAEATSVRRKSKSEMDDRTAASENEEELSTKALLARHRQGDAKAADRIFMRLLPQLYRFGRGRLPHWVRGSVDTADVVQDVSVKMLRLFDRFPADRPGDLAAYARQAFRNRVRDEIRRAQARGPLETLPEVVAQEGNDAVDLVQFQEDYSLYECALSRLNERDRRLIDARVHLGLSYKQVAELNAYESVDAARMACRRALDKLEKMVRKGKMSRPG